MNLSDNGANLIASFEGFRSCPYRDAVGVWTIGYGSTKGVGPSTPCVTKAQALARMKAEVQSTYGAAVNNLGLPLNQNQYDALTSFVYNCGPGAIAASTTVGKQLRNRNWQAAADALLAWNKAGGKVLAGLTRRRQAERALFLAPTAASPAAPPPKPPEPEEIEVILIKNDKGWTYLTDGAFKSRIASGPDRAALIAAGIKEVTVTDAQLDAIPDANKVAK